MESCTCTSGSACSNCFPYQNFYHTYQEPQYDYLEPASQLYTMRDQRPSSNGYDVEPQQQHRMSVQASPHFFHPPQLYHEYYYAPEVPRHYSHPSPWQMQPPPLHSQPLPQPPRLAPRFVPNYSYQQASYATQFHQTHLGYMAIGPQHTASYGPIVPRSPAARHSTPLAHYQHDLHSGLSNVVSRQDGTLEDRDVQVASLGTSPDESYLGSHSHSSSSSDDGWHLVEASPRGSHRSYVVSAQRVIDLDAAAVHNPGSTLHHRSDSSSTNEEAPSSAGSYDSFDHVQFQMDSPEPEPARIVETIEHSPRALPPSHNPAHSSAGPAFPVDPGDSPGSSPPATPAPRPRARKQPQAISPKGSVRKPAAAASKIDSDSVDKRGKRKGRLSLEQRRQAGQVRKMRACLRCKFLKKTCDTNEICAGCKPSHTRLWQVPCTRIDIKELGYFLDGWKVDTERHSGHAIPANAFVDKSLNGALSTKRQLRITHGYGHDLCLSAHDVKFRNGYDDYRIVEWLESKTYGMHRHQVATAQMDVTGVDSKLLHAYVEKHFDPRNGSFPDFVRTYFEGSRFLSEICLTAYRYQQATGNPVVKKALKLLVTYNLTTHIAFVENPDQLPDRSPGHIAESSSSFQGKVVAPVLVDQAIRNSLAEMWRDLQKDVLAELSAMFTNVYTKTGDKLKTWPTIFITASLLLAVWEEMQWDAHYREPNHDAIDKFCDDMESTPVGVITGLFQAISQKMPGFHEWNYERHHHLLGSDEAACNVMSEVRDHFYKHENYLKHARDSKPHFDQEDFDCFTTKLMSKLVIK